MTPSQVLQELLKINRPAANLLLVGMGAFAAAAIVASFGIEPSVAAVTAGYIVGFSAAIAVVVWIVGNQLIKTTLGWFLTILFMAWSASVLISLIAPGRTFLQPAPCLLKFWDKCGVVLDRIADETYTGPVTPITPAIPAPPPSAAIPKSNFQVFVQFAGVIRREDVRAMMSGLKGDGWNVQGVSGGGDRTVAAIGYNEIRYGPGGEPAARLLAGEVQKANIAAKPLTVVQTKGFDSSRLEVWISR